LCVVISFLAILAACSPASQEKVQYKIAFVPARSGSHGIFTINSDTTGARLLTQDVTAQLRATSWAPDGRRIAFFATRRQDADLLKAYRTPLHFPLYLIDAAGGKPRRLLDFPVSSFAWAPDSEQLLFVSAYEDPQRNDPDVVNGTRAPMSAAYILNLTTGDQKRLTGFGQNCSGSWSPDGSQVALSFGTYQSSDIYLVNLKSKQTRRLTESQDINVRPVWSPNGKMIAYLSYSPSSGGGQTAAVHVIDADGARKRRLIDMNTYQVAWSPDGKSLLMQSAATVFLVDPWSAKADNPMPVYVNPMDAIFTPDGGKIVFRSNHEGPWSLYTLDLSSKKIKRISGNLSASMFCISPAIR
jgi:Tol biopolymer transport system component